MVVLADPSLEHQIQIHMSGNAHVYVSCNCMYRALASLNRRHKAVVKRSLEEYGTLGHFPVGTPTAELLAVYNEHLVQAAE